MIALIQRPRRKTHLAASLDDQQAWASLCDIVVVPFTDATFTGLDAAYATVRPDDDTICVHCRRMIALVHILNRIDTRRGGRHLHIAS